MLFRNAIDNDDFQDDPGNLLDRIDGSVLPFVRTDHVGLDGRDHVTPEELERLNADLLPVALWAGVRQ